MINKIMNLTNHPILIYRKSAVEPASRHYPDEYKLIPGRENDFFIKIPQSGYPVCAHYFPVYDNVDYIEGMPFRQSKSYFTSLDPLPLTEADIFIVSSKYAEEGSRNLPAEVADLLFVPGEKVLDKDGNTIGTLSLRTFLPYWLLPSAYTNSNNMTIIALAVHYWQRNLNCLSYFEQLSLQNLMQRIGVLDQAV